MRYVQPHTCDHNCKAAKLLKGIFCFGNVGLPCVLIKQAVHSIVMSWCNCGHWVRGGCWTVIKTGVCENSASNCHCCLQRTRRCCGADEGVIPETWACTVGLDSCCLLVYFSENVRKIGRGKQMYNMLERGEREFWNSVLTGRAESEVLKISSVNLEI